jgi:integrase
MLRLHTSADGVSTWRKFVLGDCTDRQGLKWAREQAAKIRHQFKHEGRDPTQERRARITAAKAQADRDRFTLGVLVEEWQREHLAGKRERYAYEAVRALRAAFAGMWNRPAEELDHGGVMRALRALRKPLKGAPEPRGSSRTKGNAIASRTAAYGRACYSWAVKHQLVKANPFDAVPLSDFKTEARDRVLTDNELAAIWLAAEAPDCRVFGSLVSLLILTGQRREEVAGIAWAELSPDRQTWIIPASRAKNGKDHLVPLSAAARDLLPEKLDADERETELVFPGQRGTPFNGWSKSKAQLDKDSDVAGWRIHDLRRTLATGLQRLGVRLEVTEAVLNHVSGSRAGIVGIYQRHEWAAEKRAALDAWAEHVMALVRGRDAAGNVVALRRA